MNETPVGEFVARTISVWVGLALVFVGFVCWLFALAGLTYGLSGLGNPEHDLSTLPIITVTLAALGTLGLTLGWRLMKGLPVHVPFTRKVLGVVLLLFSAILFIVSREDPGVPWWPAAILGFGGLASLLTWKKASRLE